MELTRRNHKTLKQAVDKATAKLDEVNAVLEPLLPLLTDAQRASVPRVRADFPDAARSLAHASADHGDIVAATEYEAEAVLEDLDNVRVLDELAARLAIAQQRIDDARLLWNAEAFVPTMELYGVAKVRAKKDGKLAKAIEPLADVLSTPRKKTKGDTK
jgi:hypothetical protein